MSQVFISYVRDGGIGEKTAITLHNQLSQAEIPAFRDVENIDPGSHWVDVIQEQILASKLMIVVLSKQALDTKRWVFREVLYASDNGIPIIPISVENISIPMWISHINVLDFSHTQNWNRLLVTVGKHIPNEPVENSKQKVKQKVSKASSTNKIENTQNTIASRYTPEIKNLLEELKKPQTKPPRRLAIGNKLNDLNDSREGIGLNQQGLPDIDWVKIPTGAFNYQEDEKLYLDNYYMSRYPITNQQFQAFVKAGGFKESKWWKDLKNPDDLPNHEWTQDNRPVERVSWYDAMAFCRWLSAEQGYEIRLPTEQEWEKAARGTDERDYPWGNSYKTGFANIDETENKAGDFYLEETSAVGMYPQGESPYGLLDMSGNVLEWCLNKYDEPNVIAADVSGDARSVRGGSWGYGTGDARASFRFFWFPDYRYYFQGFRVVCFSPITDH